MAEPSRDVSPRSRDAGVVRLRRVTRGAAFAAVGLAGAFAGLAAHSFAGHKARAAVVRTRTVREVQTVTQAPAQATHAPPTTTSAPPPPVVTPVAPVAVSGAT
ncbi:MAG TPA: hypothetical protein VKB73_06580 [Gaiellaceae bacterium]|nr:hypothetical protein [Gaiellaceae bacterium]